MRRMPVRSARLASAHLNEPVVRMEQLPFELAVPELPTFANFITGRNGEAVDLLRRLAAGEATVSCVLLWGGAGAGRSHLLQAAVAAALEGGRPAAYCTGPAAAPAEPPDVGAVVAVDDIDTADVVAQGHLFTLFNRLADTGGHLVAASAAPPARLPLRADLRSRVQSGLAYEIVPLADADKPAALAAYARSRGIDLDGEVIAYLLAHGRRDMSSLLATLAALDRESLAAKRPITVPLLRAWMQRALALNRPP